MLLADDVATYHPIVSGNPYQPHMARIVRIYKMVENNHLFTLRFLEDNLAHSFRHQPGQIIMLSVPGAGETASGESVERMMAPLPADGPQPIAWGLNCGLGPDGLLGPVEQAVRSLRWAILPRVPGQVSPATARPAR